MIDSKLADLILNGAAELRLAWRRAARFDDVAVMHITANGVPMLQAISKLSGSEAPEAAKSVLSTPPWTGNESDADAPASLLVSLEVALRELAGDDSELLTAVEHLVGTLAAAIDSQQRERTRSLQELAATDALTGSLSRGAVLEQLEIECARARRYGRPLSVIFLDVDALKRTNDEEGHGAGDELLRKAVDAVRHHLRASDAVGRLGGDEFLLVLPETDMAGAETVASKVAVHAAEIGVGVTCGAAGTPGTEPDASALVETADSAMRALRARRA